MNHGEAIYCRTWLDRPAESGHKRDCEGCLSSPDPQCACCPAPTAVIVEAGDHAMTFCRYHWSLVLACRAQAAAEATSTIGRAAKAEKERIA